MSTPSAAEGPESVLTKPTLTLSAACAGKHRQASPKATIAEANVERRRREGHGGNLSKTAS
jgi:hypothetical protein